jgi:hypothetical protein
MAREIAAVRKIDEAAAVGEIEGVLEKVARRNDKSADDEATEKAA